jgi:hypothetical protein
MWVKRVTYRPKGHTGSSLYMDFPIKAHHNTMGLTVREEPVAEVKGLMLKHDVTGSSYKYIDENKQK